MGTLGSPERFPSPTNGPVETILEECRDLLEMLQRLHPADVKTFMQNLLLVIPVQAPQTEPARLRQDWTMVVCFSCGKAGHSATRCPALNESFPFMLPGWKAEKEGGSYAMISPRVAGSVAGRETATDPGGGGGSATRISNKTRPQDPKGGEAQINTTRDGAMAWPLAQPMSQTVPKRPETVGVSAVLVQATPGRSARILPSVSDSVVVIAEGFQSEDGTSSECGPLWEAGQCAT